MQKSLATLFIVALVILQISHCATSSNSAAVDLFVDYYLENVVHYFYSIAPAIEYEINQFSHHLNDSSIAGDATKTKTLQYIRISIDEILEDLKRRHQGCQIHLKLTAALNKIRDLIVDAGDRQLLLQFNQHTDVIEDAIDWNYYDMNRAKVMHEIQMACEENGFERQYSQKLAEKLC